MIKRFGYFTYSTYSQTLNWWDKSDNFMKVMTKSKKNLNEFVLSGPSLVSRAGDAGWTERLIKMYKFRLMRHQERCWFFETERKWTWKSSTSQYRVTTNFPNESALKIDYAKALESKLRPFVILVFFVRRFWI